MKVVCYECIRLLPEVLDQSLSLESSRDLPVEHLTKCKYPSISYFVTTKMSELAFVDTSCDSFTSY